jgi:glyoxylate/hydroxypyruvate reductase A
VSAGRVLLAMSGYDPEDWRRPLETRRTVTLAPDGPRDPSIRFAIVWKQLPPVLFTLPNLKAIFSAGAGVDHLLANPKLPDVPIVRVVADNLTRHMVEYVCWRVLDHHRQGSTYRAQQPRKVWHEPRQPDASQVSVGIMGLGNLGRACAKALLALGFPVNGWTRTEATMEGVRCWHGADGLPGFLAATDILVVLLPLTPATQGIVDYGLLRQLRRDGPLGGPMLINAGRGRLQREADIVRALDDGTLKEASLDVFETEPLPADSPLWSHPRVFVTPHAAATSWPEHLVPLMLDQMDAFDRGEPLRNVVDRAAGY